MSQDKVDLQPNRIQTRLERSLKISAKLSVMKCTFHSLLFLHRRPLWLLTRAVNSGSGNRALGLLFLSKLPAVL